MTTRNRANPLALAILVTLAERPMHPYEVATTLRQRAKHESVRLNYGSLYAVVASLEKRGLISPRETVRQGRLPERTVYELTDAGRVEMHDWLTELLSVPVNDFPAFGAALSFLAALPPGDVVALLHERAQRLELEAAQARATRELLREEGLPRLFWVEEEFRAVLRDAELAYVRRLAGDIATGSLEGVDLWATFHADRDPIPADAVVGPYLSPAPTASGSAAGSRPTTDPVTDPVTEETR